MDESLVRNMQLAWMERITRITNNPITENLCNMKSLQEEYRSARDWYTFWDSQS